jgi:hypothetical protein
MSRFSRSGGFRRSFFDAIALDFPAGAHERDSVLRDFSRSKSGAHGIGRPRNPLFYAIRRSCDNPVPCCHAICKTLLIRSRPEQDSWSQLVSAAESPASVSIRIYSMNI